MHIHHIFISISIICKYMFYGNETDAAEGLQGIKWIMLRKR